jgi:prevent-host-death family protein
MLKEEVPAGYFKAHCLKLINDVQSGNKSMLITKRGVPMAELIPYAEHPPLLFGWMKSTVTLLDTIIDPIDIQWNADE